MRKHRSVEKIWMYSFSLVIFMMMAIFTACFIYIRGMIQQEELERSASENHFLKTVLDEKFISVTDLAMDLIYRPAQLFPHINGENKSFNNSDVYRLMTELESHTYSSSVIEDIFIYYPSEDFIIGCNGPRCPETYYYFYNDFSKEGYDQWKEGILSRSQPGFFLYDGRNGAPDLLYESSLKLEDGISCHLYIKLDRQGISEVLEEADVNHMTKLFAIISDKNQIYTSSGEKDLLSLAADAGKNSTFLARSMGRYFVSSQSSYSPVISYFTVSSKSTVLQLSGSITLLLLTGLVIFALSGLPAAIYLIRRNLKPVKTLMNKLVVNGPSSQDNEYEVLGKEVDSLLDHYSSAVHRLEESQLLLNRAFVEVILNGDQKDSGAIASLAAIYGIDLPYSGFCTAVCEIADADRDACEKMLPPPEENLEFCWGYLEGRLAVILNFETEDTQTGSIPRDYLQHMDDALNARTIRHRIAAGGVYHTPAGISLSYSEALYVLELSSENLIYYRDSGHKIGEKEGNAAFYEFQQHLLERCYTEAELLLGSLFEQYIMNTNPVVYRYKKMAVIQLVYEAVRRETVGTGAVWLMEEQFTDKLFQPGSPARIQQNIKNILDQLAAIVLYNSENDGSLAIKAKSLIESGFADPMLGLSSVAEKLGVSPSHLSRVFKREIGQGIAEFINRTRILASKKLIQEGRLNIKEIALSVGYSSDANFIRVFKKYENITPGKYEILEKDKNCK